MSRQSPRKRATEASAHRLSAQNAAVEASPNAVVAIDGQGRIVNANRQLERIFGYEPTEVLGQPIELLLPERIGRRHAFDLAGRRKDGTEFPVEISLAPVETAAGRQVFASIVDVTERRPGESALAESERRFRAVLEAGPNAVVAIDARGWIVYANLQVERMFGYELAEVVGQPIELLVPERVAVGHQGHRNGFFTHPVARPMGIGLDLAGRHKDGTEFPVEISLAPVDTADGLQVFATVVDITARKAAENQLLQAQKLESIGRLAGGIAHDFNNMLFAIRGYAELLTQDLTAMDRRVEPDPMLLSVNAISQAAERATALTAQLLAFGRQQMVTMTVLDLNTAVNTVEPMLNQLIGENVQLVLKLDSSIGHIRADAGQIDQIVVNLVVNARDAMPGGGTVTIETGSVVFDEPYVLGHVAVTPGSYALLIVSDTGMGMDRATREHLYEPFFTTKEVGKGTGLGLATTYGIVHQAGGHIWLYSEPGHGSTFKLYFPTVDGPVVEEQPVMAATPPVGSGTVLVVEDEPWVRDMTTQLLERSGYTVRAVADGAEAIALARSAKPFDVLVTDVIMPNMSGIELAERMMDGYPGIGVILLSGYTAETLDLARLTARGAAFVPKPVTPNRLVQAVHQAVPSSRPTASRP